MTTTTADLMGACALVAALADSRSMPELEAARLAAIKGTRVGRTLAVTADMGDAYLLLAGADPAWDGRPRTVAAWISALTAAKVVELGQVDGTALPISPSGHVPLPIGSAARADYLEAFAQPTGGDL